MLTRVLFLLSVLLWLSACGTRAPSPKPGRADSGVDLGGRETALLQVALNATTACLTALPGGCTSVPTSFPNLTATNYLP
jgi:hypothetical protein